MWSAEDEAARGRDFAPSREASCPHRPPGHATSACSLAFTRTVTSVTSDGQWRKVGKTPFFHLPPDRYIRYIQRTVT